LEESVSFAVSTMLKRINIVAVYLLLCCMLFEHAAPCFAGAALIEICENQSESEGKDPKTEQEISYDLKAMKERFQLSEIRDLALSPLKGRFFADLERIPDSKHQPVNSPPPDLF